MQTTSIVFDAMMCVFIGMALQSLQFSDWRICWQHHYATGKIGAYGI